MTEGRWTRDQWIAYFDDLPAAEQAKESEKLRRGVEKAKARGDYEVVPTPSRYIDRLRWVADFLERHANASLEQAAEKRREIAELEEMEHVGGNLDAQRRAVRQAP